MSGRSTKRSKHFGGARSAARDTGKLEHYKKPAHKRVDQGPAPFMGAKSTRKALLSHDLYEMGAEDPYDIVRPKQTIPTRAGVVTLLNGPVLGSGAFYERTNLDVKGHSLQVKGCWSLKQGIAASPAANTQYYRTMIVWDANPEGGVVPPITDILKDTTIKGKQTDSSISILAGMDRPNTVRFYVLKDKRFALVSVGGNWETVQNNLQIAGQDALIFDEYIKLKGLITKFKASTGTAGSPVVGDIASGALYLINMVDTFPTMNQEPVLQFNWVSRYKYADN